MKIRLFMIVGLFLLAFAGAPRHAVADDGGLFFMVNPKALVSPCNQVYTKTEFKPWYSDILKTVESSAMGTGGNIYGKLVGGTKRFMGALLGLWIALLALKQVGSMTETDGLEFATKIGGICLKAAFVFILINQSTFKEFIWTPIVEGVPNEVGNPAAGGAEKALGKAMKAGEATKCIASIWGFDFSLGKYPKGDMDPGLTDPGIYVHGCFPIFFAFLLSIAIPIFLCDLYLRKGIVFAFCPLFVAAFLFPATKDFGNKGVNAALNIIFYQIVLYILLEIAGSILINSAGLAKVSGNMNEATVKGLMCSLRLFGSSDAEECKGTAGYSGNNLIVMVVMGCYCIYMLTLADKFAEFFSGASFGETGSAALGAVKKAGSAMNQGVGMAKGAAKMTGRFAGRAMDRMAARTVESARSGGKPGGFKTGLASFYLKQRGILNKDGSETKAYGNALANGTRRSIANFLSGGRLYKNEDYQNWAKNGPRDNAAAAAADSAYQNRLNGKGNEPSNPSGSMPKASGTPKNSIPAGRGSLNNNNPNAPSGNNPSDRGSLNNNNPNAPSGNNPSGGSGIKDSDEARRNRMQNQHMHENIARNMENEIANTDYSKMPNGEAQKQYDQMAATAAKNEADFASKVTGDPNYANTKEGKEHRARINKHEHEMYAMGDRAGVDMGRMHDVATRTVSSMNNAKNETPKLIAAEFAQRDAIKEAEKNGEYPGGEKQKNYDKDRADQSRAWARYYSGVQHGIGYETSAEGRAELKSLQAKDAALADYAKANNLDTSRMDNAAKSVENPDYKILDYNVAKGGHW